MTAKFWKKFVIKKIILGSLILIMGVFFGILTNFASPISVDAVTSTALEQAQGRSSVDVTAVSTMFGGFVSIGSILTQVALFIFGFAFAFAFGFDLVVDIVKIVKKEEGEKA